MSTVNPSNEPTSVSADMPTKPVAVIDIGASQIRMAIAQIGRSGSIKILETLSQAVDLGKDTFTKGMIRKSTIEECVRSLKSYLRVLRAYDIADPDQMRVVAPSAVREAQNRLAFLDRVYIATGIQVEPIDEAEVTRITYLGIQPFVQSGAALLNSRSIIIEVGGGSTEVLIAEQDNISFSHTYRLGSLRLKESLKLYRGTQAQLRTLMENQIERTTEELQQHLPPEGTIEMIALGGDVRFAVNQLNTEWDRKGLACIRVSDLAKLTDQVLSTSEDELVQQYHINFPTAETLGPALLAYLQVARALSLERIHVSNVNMRDGLLREMATREVWTSRFSDQVVSSAVDLARRYEVDLPHSIHVAQLADKIFTDLQQEHELSEQYRWLLYVAAILHEIGLFVSNQAYHKHSMYVINNSEVFGLGKKQLLIVALIARYHRRSSPKSSHEGYTALDRDSRIAVAKLAAILRVADALDRSYSQRIAEITCHAEEDRLVVEVPNVEDLSLEQLALRQKGTLFEEVYGMRVQFRLA